MLNINCSLLHTCLYLLTFTIVLPLICFLSPLRHSVYYQLFTRLSVLLKPDRTSQLDNDLLNELFTKNSERLDVANRFLELQQPSFVRKNVSTFPVKYQGKSYVKGGADLAQQVPSLLEHTADNTAVTVSVVIISAGRDIVVSNGEKFSPRYLTQNVARFMALTSEQKHSDQVSYQLLVCSVGEHITAEELSVGRVVQAIRDPQLDSGFTFGPFHDRLAWRYEKEKRDYTFCLRQAAYGVKFVLIVEDDALPLNESLSVISRLVTGQWTSRPDSHTVAEQFYVKLYHPVHLQGGGLNLQDWTVMEILYGRTGRRSVDVDGPSVFYVHNYFGQQHCLCYRSCPAMSNSANLSVSVQSCNFSAPVFSCSNVLTCFDVDSYISMETERLPQLVAAAIVLGSCLYLVVIWCASARTTDRSLTLKCMPWIYCSVYCGLIVLCVGRVHIQSWRRLFAPYAHYLVSDKFCCTQAILYTAKTAHDLAAYLDNTSCNETYHKDDALWKFTTSGYLIQPNVFEHVGVWSTVRRGFVDPHTIN